MAKVIIDFKQTRPFKEGDILIYNEKSKSFVLTTKELYLRAITNEMSNLKAKYELDITDMKKSLETFKNGVNNKLREYHEILHNLTKGE